MMKKVSIQPIIHDCTNLSCINTLVGLPLFTSTIVICKYLINPASTNTEVIYKYGLPILAITSGETVYRI